MEFTYRSNWDQLFLKLDKLEKNSAKEGTRLVHNAAVRMDSRAREKLRTQGRGPGQPPPLTAMTQHIYSVTGEPDGSGIHDHMEIFLARTHTGYTAVFGIRAGKPSMIARVQNSGALIPVTEKMRGFLSAQYGIHLRESTTHIVIPGRHFWDQALSKSKAEVRRGFKNFFRKVLR